MSFAEGTSVPVERSRAEIEKLVVKYGATHFASGWMPGGAVLTFQVKDRFVRFDLPLPDENDKSFALSNRRRYGARVPNTDAQRRAARDQDHRRRWRALCLVIKAKLEAVESGITTFEEEFLAHLVVPGGKTFAQWALPQLAQAYERGIEMPPLLGGGS